jgi:hypothetical protein
MRLPPVNRALSLLPTTGETLHECALPAADPVCLTLISQALGRTRDFVRLDVSSSRRACLDGEGTSRRPLQHSRTVSSTLFRRSGEAQESPLRHLLDVLIWRRAASCSGDVRWRRTVSRRPANLDVVPDPRLW